ncbi:MAG: HAMP domain-containing protein [Gammaproteobacteria bacterium]|nr:HAMP domain-containing protein [Gammaproteobacteria bacterium]
MLSRIRYKFFVAILVANSLLLVVVYLTANWIFSTSFRDYLDRSEADRLQPLVQELSLLYRQRGGWHWLKGPGNKIWNRLMREHLDNRALRLRPNQDRHRPAPPPGLADPDHPPPPPPGHADPDHPLPPGLAGGPLAIRSGILLKDTAHRLVIGRPQSEPKAYWVPIVVNSETVGYLGFVRRLDIDGELDRLFADRVQNYLAVLLLGMLLITALIAVPLAGRFVVPIERLRAAMRELASGNFQVSLARQGRDEVADLQGDFNRLAETMAKNLEARQRWIADISHELRTPVAVLRGEIEAIIDGVRQPDQVYIKSLHQEIMRLTHLIDDLYQLSLSDQGAMSSKNRELDLKTLLASTVEQQNSLFETEALTIEFHPDRLSYPVFGDHQRLKQLFSNLANNSRFYTEKPGLVRIDLSQVGDRAVIEWSDSAPGVSDAELSRLFDRLYRVEESRNRNAGGSGLGLAICRNIVESMQGTINADHSTLGGVKITISLPLVG